MKIFNFTSAQMLSLGGGYFRPRADVRVPRSHRCAAHPPRHRRNRALPAAACLSRLPASIILIGAPLSAPPQLSRRGRSMTRRPPARSIAASGTYAMLVDDLGGRGPRFRWCLETMTLEVSEVWVPADATDALREKFARYVCMVGDAAD